MHLVEYGRHLSRINVLGGIDADASNTQINQVVQVASNAVLHPLFGGVKVWQPAQVA